jgi:hypothetical protein
MWPTTLALLGSIKEMIVILGAGAGSAWAIYQYSRSRQFEAAKWAHSLYNDFYNSERFKQVRLDFEYKYMRTVAPLLQKRVTDRDLALSDEEMWCLQSIDNFLNHFELLLTLVDRDQISRRDALDPFEYWFSLMNQDRCGSLRAYIGFGYEKIEKELGVKPPVGIFLTESQLASIQRLPQAQERLPAVVRGISSQSSGFSLTSGPDSCGGVLLRFSSPSGLSSALKMIDRALDFNPSSFPHCSFHRTAFRVFSSKNLTIGDAWVYGVGSTLGPDSADGEGLGRIGVRA